jgi:hypothetical protein
MWQRGSGVQRNHLRIANDRNCTRAARKLSRVSNQDITRIDETVA